MANYVRKGYPNKSNERCRGASNAHLFIAQERHLEWAVSSSRDDGSKFHNDSASNSSEDSSRSDLPLLVQQQHHFGRPLRQKTRTL